MFSSRFLTQAADRNPISATPAQRSNLFTRRTAMRCNLVSEPPSISPMTAALVSAADQRTTRPEVPSVAALNTADATTTSEATQVPIASMENKSKKREKKRKSEVCDAAPRKQSRRKSGGTRDRKTKPNAATVEAENSARVLKISPTAGNL